MLGLLIMEEMGIFPSWAGRTGRPIRLLLTSSSVHLWVSHYHETSHTLMRGVTAGGTESLSSVGKYLACLLSMKT